MSYKSPSSVSGCLIDLSAPHPGAAHGGKLERRVADSLGAMLGSALELAQAERDQDHYAVMFVGLVGLKSGAGTSCVDLCRVAEALLPRFANHSDGYDLLIDAAKHNNLAYVTKYIRTNLTEAQAYLVAALLRRHPEHTTEFRSALPSRRLVKGLGYAQFALRAASRVVSVSLYGISNSWLGMLIAVAGALGTDVGTHYFESRLVKSSEAMRLVQRTCNEFPHDFSTLTPRPVAEVLDLLRQLQVSISTDGGACKWILEILGQWAFGDVVVEDTVNRSLAAFSTPSMPSVRRLAFISHKEMKDSPSLGRELQLADIMVEKVCALLPFHDSHPSCMLTCPDTSLRIHLSYAVALNVFLA